MLATCRLVRLAYRAKRETHYHQACGGPAGLDVAIIKVAYDGEGALLSLMAACVSLAVGIIHVCWVGWVCGVCKGTVGSLSSLGHRSFSFGMVYGLTSQQLSPPLEALIALGCAVRKDNQKKSNPCTQGC